MVILNFASHVKPTETWRSVIKELEDSGLSLTKVKNEVKNKEN